MTRSAVAAAGGSQAAEVARSRARIREYERLLRQERQRLGRHEVARRTERQVAARLLAMQAFGWHLLADRRWPVRVPTRANVDMLHVGPGGVLVVDVKAWREPRVVGDRLFNGDEDSSDSLDVLLRVTGLVEDALAPLGLSPVHVEPVVVLAGRTAQPVRLGRAVVLGERDVVPWAGRRGARLRPEEVAAVAGALASAFPPYDVPPESATSTTTLEPVLSRLPVREDEQLELLELAEIERGLLDAALAEPVEQWMTFLHPAQHAVVGRTANGPSRVRGSAGTGKTVVGLHRAAHLAARTQGRLLYASHVRTLPTVLAAAYARLSPHTADRVEFTGVHRWAHRFLRDRGVRVHLDARRAESLFTRTWASVGRYGALASLPVHPGYWWEEVQTVVKGRGLTDFRGYAALQRVGRRTPLLVQHREAVWDLHQAYDVALREAGVHDYADLLLLALAELRRRPLEDPYAAVFVDEVQDLTCTGVRLMHALVGDATNGLHLIGDGQQSVHPGGFTLAEAGIDVRGRSTVLTTNYRNASRVLAVAHAVVGRDDFDDLEGVEHGARDVDAVRAGGATTRIDADDVASHDLALLAALRRVTEDGTTSLGDCAVLTATKAMAATYRRVLVAAGFDVLDLADYAGVTCGRVKVGTIKRSKGLEFKRVFLPRLQESVPVQLAGELDAAHAERAALRRRELFVGMTRARDGLWLGYVSAPAADSTSSTSG